MTDKTEEPTEGRLRQARRDGKTAKSKDLTQTLTFAALTALLAGAFVPAFAVAMHMLRDMLDVVGHADWRLDDTAGYATGAIVVASIALGVVVALAGIAAAVLSEQLQVRGMASAKPVTPDFNKLNPINQLKAMFSLKSLVELLKNLFKVTVIGAAFLLVTRAHLSDLMNLHRTSPLGAMTVTAHLLLLISGVTVAIFLVMSGADFLYQKFEHVKSLKMSKDEVRRDYKQQEGDPEIRGERRRIHAEIMHG
ncbi:EscU/YscU/HrcU family type III secretion system export apparatus switch protein [Burkholderia pyrrocinia]|uniref:EscU/YscU/HrcU family type III secretion system export apparatus switch protein n=1 Tax=Burkholderia pyrrocinia TaxID=60550 RepID=UPI00104B4DA4|nr:EscU/YscU/HrcU family type III secretion system export apparatus switch protein [Burkholderia pyrrocinia]TDA48273.1 EscU/YscU/HrcU family type III secretion system export apparatus switch protein [Burkholderia pyrrocinia]